MDTSYVTTFSSLVAALGAGVPILACLLIWIRTRSLRLPLNRLWQLVLGAQEIEDLAIRKLVSENNDLMRFRLAFGINVESMVQCRRLQEWAARHALEMGEVAACGAFFDVRKLETNLPSPRMSKVRAGSLLVAVLLLVPMPFLATFDGALANLKVTGRWIVLDSQSIRPLLPFDAEVLTRERCAGSPSDPQAFTVEERNVVCKILGIQERDGAARDKPAAELAEFARGALQAQRWALAVLAASVALWGFLCARWIAAADAAYRLKQKAEATNARRADEARTVPGDGV